MLARIGAIALLVLLTGMARAGQDGRTLFKGADPAALVAEGRTWLYPTGDGSRLYAWFQDDRDKWRRGPPLISRDRIGWIVPSDKRQLWAPHMASQNGHYYLYYSVGPQEPLASQIGVAICETPAGPCRDSGKPLIDGRDSGRITARPTSRCKDAIPPTGSGRFRFEAIDPMLFVDPVSGRRLLYAGGSNGSVLRVFELAEDMMTITGEIPVDQPPCFTEGAWMHRHDGQYYLSYSSGSWNRANYHVRYVTAPTPFGPWSSDRIILVGNSRVKGPGHHSFFVDSVSGSWKIVFHGWHHHHGEGPYLTPGRTLTIADVFYRKDGTITPVEIP